MGHWRLMTVARAGGERHHCAQCGWPLIPPGLPFSLDLFAQGFSSSLTVTPGHHGPATVTLTFCTSEVEGFHIGS